MPAVAAQTLAVRLAECPSGQGKQHLLPHYILKRKPTAFIIPYFGLVLGDRSFARFGIRSLRPEQEIKLTREWNRHRLDAAGTQDFELALECRSYSDIFDQILWSAMLHNQIGLARDEQSAHLARVGRVVNGTFFNLLAKF